jgi:methyl-accepting chemotaxis protein
MLSELNATIRKVKSSADSVANGSRDIRSMTVQMSTGVAHQAAAAQEASASMEQMVANIRQTSDNAKTTEKIARESFHDAQQGGEAVAATVVAMKQISEKISIIQEIAIQTQILSMNATIEAAKAQDYGKGFAVVASEVRALAQRSREAAEAIETLVKSCVEISGEAGEILQRLVPNSQKTAELVQEISVANSEQYSGAEQINKAIQQLDQIVQQNSATAEQIAASAEEFAQQSELLQEAARFFSVKEVGTSLEDKEASLRPLLQSVLEDDEMLALLQTALAYKQEKDAKNLQSARSKSDLQEDEDPERDDAAGSEGYDIAMHTHEEGGDDELDNEFERF